MAAVRTRESLLEQVGGSSCCAQVGERNEAASMIGPGAQRPLSVAAVSRGGASLDWLTSSPGALHWVESLPEVGRSVHQTWCAESGSLVDRGFGGRAVGSDLHAYGGQPYAVGPVLLRWRVDPADGQVWDGGGRRLTGTAHTYGDLFWANDELLCVREGENGDEIVRVDPAGHDPKVLHRTDGFLATPRAHDGLIAWIQWERDVMPWDSSAIWVAGYEPGGQIVKPLRIAGGPGESAIQPQWSESGSLYYVSDRTGWWNLYRWHAGRVEAVSPMNADCATAPWESSYNNYVVLSGDRVAVTVHSGPRQRLGVVDRAGDISMLTLPYTSIKPFLAVLGEWVGLIGSSPTRAQEIALVSTDGSNRFKVVQVATESPDVAQLSVPEVLEIDSGNNVVTVLYYPPTWREAPAPLIVRPHAGPTYHIDYRLDLEVQFFTSRGFAVADVDYRGSTGYGRAFRKALDGNWGRLDVEDCRNLALHMLATGRALPGAVFISGASAGGYTALRAVCEDGPFTLAVARSAIVDPRRWTTTAPRFQQPHAAILSQDGSRVEPERLRRPVLLIHGSSDQVAPFEDVAALASAAADHDLLIGMLRLEGVGHYLSAPTAKTAALEAELAAYRAVLTGLGVLVG